MELAQYHVIVIVGILAAVFCAGCMTSEAPAPVIPDTFVKNSQDSCIITGIQSGTPTPIPTTPGCAYPPLNPWTWVPESYVPDAPIKLPPSPGMLVSKADLFGTPTLRWEEYQTYIIMNSSASEGTARTEFLDHDYAGNPATLENFTYTLRITGIENPVVDTIMDDYYYDQFGNMISAHRRYIREGKYLENGEIPPAKMNKGSPDCSGNIFTPRYTYLGIEPVTVPAGSYPGAMKYIVNSDEGSSVHGSETVTYWFVSGIPVPVMKMSEDSQVVYTSKLIGWG